jgi:hypothetical protein
MECGRLDACLHLHTIAFHTIIQRRRMLKKWAGFVPAHKCEGVA